MTGHLSRALVAATVCAALGLVACAPRSRAAEEPAPAEGPVEGGREDAGTVTDPSWRQLTPEEEAVIVRKSTEAPFVGAYTDLFDEGVYACKRCGAMLYRSESKFHSDCGWPAFDQELRGAVRRIPDADGRRTEIVCAHCEGHLGHVFTGERFTETDTRHCVNSISLVFVPAAEVRTGRAIFAGGCFWGVEYWLDREPGVLEARSGYTGGTLDNPSYQDLHSKETGHAEAVEVVFDPVRTSYEKLARLFFEIHDPTQVNGQGPDLGPEYRSALFPLDEEQTAIAEALLEELRAKGLEPATRIEPAATFWPAEDYHQDYFAARGSSPTCHFRRSVW